MQSVQRLAQRSVPWSGYGDATVGSAILVAGLKVGKREGAGVGIRVGTARRIRALGGGRRSPKKSGLGGARAPRRPRRSKTEEVETTADSHKSSHHTILDGL